VTKYEKKDLKLKVLLKFPISITLQYTEKFLIYILILTIDILFFDDLFITHNL